MWTYQYVNITSQTTTTVAKGPSELKAVVVNKGAASAQAIVYDNASAGSGTIIATIDGTSKGDLQYGCRAKNGLTVVTSGGSADITVVFS